MTTEKRVLHSTLAAYGSQFTRMLVRMVVDVSLMRLVLPGGHALFALAYSIVIIAGFFRDLGLPYQVVRDPRRPFGAILAWELGAGTIVTGLLIAGAPLTARFDPELPSVLRWLALYVLFDGLALVPRVFFEAELNVRRIVAPEIVRGLVFAAVACVLGLFGCDVFSMVIGEVTATAVLAGLLWYRAWGHIRLELRPDLIAELIRHSIYLFLIALTANAIPFAGNWIVEMMVSTDMVGHYERALMWALKLQVIVVPALVRVLYPALIAYRDDQRKFVAAYHLCTVSVLSLEALTTYFLFFNADVVMLRIFGSQWGPAVLMLKVLCWVPLVEPFTRLGGEILKVRNEDRIWFAGVVLNLVSLIGFGILLTSRMGAVGMAWANYLMLGNLLIAWRLYRIFKDDFLRLCRDLLMVYAMPAPFFLIAAALWPAGSWHRFFASLVASVLAFAWVAYRFQGPVRDFLTSGPELSEAEPT